MSWDGWGRSSADKIRFSCCKAGLTACSETESYWPGQCHGNCCVYTCYTTHISHVIPLTYHMSSTCQEIRWVIVNKLHCKKAVGRWLADHLLTTYWPPTDHLLTIYRPNTDHFFTVQLVHNYRSGVDHECDNKVVLVSALVLWTIVSFGTQQQCWTPTHYL